jgi:hypothetical protein
MPNDSSTGGFLVPSSTSPAEDADLEDVVQPILVGITGLTGSLVRPRWQVDPPAQPSPVTNWCAFGVTRSQGDITGSVVHDGSGDGGLGASTEQRHETLEILASFYGPAGQGYASLLRGGLGIAQNREALFLAGMGLIECSEITAAPALVNQNWLRRYDLTIRLRRRVDRTYPVRNLLSAHGTIEKETGEAEDFDSNNART